MGPVLTTILLGVLAALVMGVWGENHQALVAAELNRERGRVWGMTCAATHRAVQEGAVTGARQVTVAELKSEGLLPAGLREADQLGLVAARYGAVVAGGVPLAACSLSGTGVDVRSPDFREGAVMGGLDKVGFVGGDETPMHVRLPDVVAVLGALPPGSMFATADFGIGHAAERVYRRPVGGRPELSAMEQRLRFEAGRNILGAATVAGESAAADRGRLRGAGRVDAAGDVLVRPSGSLKIFSGTHVEADRNFAFGGGGQGSWTIPGELAVGTSFRSRGGVAAGRVALTGDMVVEGGVSATGTVRSNRTVDAAGEAVAGSATIGSLRVGSCAGCRPPILGP